MLCGLDSARAEDVVIPHGGSLSPIGTESDVQYTLRFASRRVATDGVALMCQAVRSLLDRNGLAVSEVDLVVPHQANGRMLEAVARRLALRDRQMAANVDRVGNTSAASIPILLSELSREGRLQGRVVLAAVGAGYTYGSALLDFEP